MIKGLFNASTGVGERVFSCAEAWSAGIQDKYDGFSMGFGVFWI